MKIHLVMLTPHGFEEMRRLLKWDKVRGVPRPEGDAVGKLIYAEGMVCEIDDADLVEAGSFCQVRILSTKEAHAGSASP